MLLLLLLLLEDAGCLLVLLLLPEDVDYSFLLLLLLFGLRGTVCFASLRDATQLPRGPAGSLGRSKHRSRTESISGTFLTVQHTYVARPNTFVDIWGLLAHDLHGGSQQYKKVAMMPAGITPVAGALDPPGPTAACAPHTSAHYCCRRRTC